MDNITKTVIIPFLETVAGNELAQKLNDYKEDSSKVFYDNDDFFIRAKPYHKVAITTKDVSVGGITNDDLTIVTASTFPYDLSTYISTVDVGPLMEFTETSTWTAWYNIDCGNAATDYIYNSGNCTKINNTPEKISKKVSADIVGKVYEGSNAYDRFHYGKTIIQLNADYKTFKIPVYDGLGQPTGEVVPVTYGDTDALIPEDETNALQGIYILVYEKDTENNSTYSWIGDKADLWAAINAVVTEHNEFDVSKAKLVRDVTYSISESSKRGDYYKGDFSSLDLLNNNSTAGRQYFNSHSASGDNIWDVRTSIDYSAYTYTNAVNDTITDILTNTNTDIIYLTNMKNIAVTAEKPEVNTEIDADPEVYITIDVNKVYDYPVTKYPAATDSLATHLTTNANPTAGYKYDTDNWTLWDFAAESGVVVKNNIPVSDNSKIGIDDYKNIVYSYASGLLVYFPQTAIKVDITGVEAPAINGLPDTEAVVPVGGGYRVTDVSWYDGETRLSANDTFGYEKQYTVKVTLTPDAGLAFINDTPVTFNGVTPTAKTINQDGTMTVSFAFDEIVLTAITAADVFVTAPAIGKVPSTNADVLDGAQFTVSDVTWSPADARFKSGTQYTVSAKLTPNSGFKFTEDTVAKINGNTASAVLNDDGTLTVSYPFARLSGGSSGGSGSSVSKPDDEPTYAKTAKSVGWTNITNEIKSSAPGSTIEITMNHQTVIPESALQAAINSKVKLVLDAGSGNKWIIDGAKANSAKYTDLTVYSDNVSIPEAAYKNIGCSANRQFKVRVDTLNFLAQLNAFVGNAYAGKKAAVYFYNEKTGKLMFQNSAVVDKDGRVPVNVACSGSFFIALGSEISDSDFLYGDSNGDGIINALDASELLKNVVSGNPVDNRNSDVNSDGTVSALDAMYILQYVVDIITEFPAANA